MKRNEPWSKTEAHLFSMSEVNGPAETEEPEMSM